MIRYELQPADPEAHLYEVALTIGSPDPQGQALTLPAWIFGSYLIRDFARHIISLTATRSDGSAVAPTKTDKQTWRFPKLDGPLTVRYQVYAWDLSVRGAHLDQTHGYFNGTSVFLRVVGAEAHPCAVAIKRPRGNSFRHWALATTLKPVNRDGSGFGDYKADGYWDLIEHPTEMGVFQKAEFALADTPHEIVVSGRCRTDMKRLGEDLQKVCGEHVRMFGELPQMPKYLFLAMLAGDGYGGLEHTQSCSLLAKRSDLPVVGDVSVTKGYRRFLGLCSHEYFHLWNVKRIRPQPIAASDLSAEAYTRQLWIFEGITSYYDDLALARSGLITAQEYLDLVSQTISRVIRGSGRRKQSMAESSFDAWTKFYKQDENAPNAVVSYYAKGALIALALDLIIRLQTDHGESLDSVMRVLWQRYGKTDKPLPEGEFEQIAEEVTGLSLDGFFRHTVYGTDDPMLESLLDAFGVCYRLRAAHDQNDLGGAGKQAPEKAGKTIGARYYEAHAELRLTHVFDGGPARDAGLSAGDVLVAVDGLRASRTTLEDVLERALSDTPIPVHAFRRDELMAFQVTPASAPADTCDLWLNPDAGEKKRLRLKEWLGNP